MEVQKQTVNDQLAAMGAATAQVVQLTGAVPDKVDPTAVGAAISTISSNLPDMTKGVKTIAALMEEDNASDRLLDATRKLCGAFSDFLNAVNPEHEETRQTVLTAAGRVGDYSHAMIQTIEEPTDEAKEFQDILVQLAKAVASCSAQVVLKAKTVSSQCEDRALQDKVVHSATQSAFATSQLVACARIVAPTIDSPACQEQLTDAARQVAKAVEQLLKDSEAACRDEKSLGDLKGAAAQLTRALNDLLNHIKTGPQQAKVTRQDQELETIITSTDRLISYTGSANEMVRQAKVLAQATTHLVSHIQGEAETRDDNEGKDKLLGAAKRLADATTSMIDAAKLTAGSPQSAEHQIALRAAAEGLRSATSDAASDQIRKKAVQRLEQAAKHTAASATQTIAAANACEPSSRNSQAQQSLTQDCQDVADYVPPLIASVRQSQSHPDDILSQMELLRISSDVLAPCGQLVHSGRAAVPTVSHQSASMQLSHSTQQLSESLAELRISVTRLQEIRAHT